MLKVAIVGATGYIGVELVRLLAKHPEVEITMVTSEKFDGLPLAEVFPFLEKGTGLVCQSLAVDKVAQVSDFIFTALPHTKAMEVAAQFLEIKKKVIDLSADFRFCNQKTYEKWYQSHLFPHFLKKAVYGLPELYRKSIRGATLVANPGCYPTSVILALAPLVKNRVIDLKSIIADSKSGISGAGRSVVLDNLFPEVNEGFKAYQVAQHRHTPEIEEKLSILAGKKILITFIPHLSPMNRGILSTIYARPTAEVTSKQLLEKYQEFYQEEKFIRISPLETFPSTSQVKFSNYCDIGLKVDRRTNRIIVISAIDNLVKGGSGQAVQNMNIMNGFPEDAGIDSLPIFP